MDKDFFLSFVKESFLFLNTDYKFIYKGIKDTSRNFSILYEKNDLIVELKYNKPNKYFEVSIFNNVHEIEEINHDIDSSIGLTWLIIKYEPTNNKEINNLKIDSLEEMIKYKALLLRKYGDSILSGKEWFSWGDVINSQK